MILNIWKWPRTSLLSGVTLTLVLGISVDLGQPARAHSHGGETHSHTRESHSHAVEHSVTDALQREIVFYQNRIQANPTDGLDRASLATLYLQLASSTGNTHWYHEAEETARQSLANLPFNNPEAQLALAKVAQAEHQFAEALQFAETVLQENPTNQQALSIVVTSKLAQGQLDQAQPVADQLVEQAPTLVSHTLRALVLVAQGEDQAALQDFQQALALEQPDQLSQSAWARTLLGRYYAHRGQLPLAKQYYQEALQLQPHSSFARVKLAELETRQGNYGAAETLYQQLLQHPESSHGLDHVALQGLAQLKVLEGKLTEASQLWDEAEHEFRDHQDLDHFGHRRDLAKLLLARGHQADLPEALTLMQAEANLRQDPETLKTLAWALSRLNRYGEAQSVLQDAIALGIQDASLFYRASLVEASLGNKAQAKVYVQKALAIDPNFDTRARALLALGG
ncbi:tetratricopeptide repeat protein [Acaryochloris marina]|uniref:TPR domain protein n=1 Tax=Acaryochloris marina (strain MBIC 11017) TaxID=329726 RepID=B0C6N0_ACAM1|nr:tetratricopeptide repeat protein [Acaryochloris marina]ABW27586.1 TPR domain protein [Acaryochloris marina MBIC11017]BDM82321.1 hypothetical protein AM10699_51850 [Acaryochloris marina MBIC10699]